MKKSAAVGVGFSTASMAAIGDAGATQQIDGPGILNDKSRKLIEKYKLRYPIFQAAPGGRPLAVEVANAGAMGAIYLSWHTPEDAFDTVTWTNEATNGNYYANFVLHFEPHALDKALEAGCPNVQFSWGIPDRDMVARIRAAGAGLGIQVSSTANAVMALEREPDFLICQGIEAGGHVQATSLLSDSLTEVVELAGDIPVLAAGGISTGHDMRRVMHAGAAGAVFGTRMMATQESEAHDVYRKHLLEAGADSTVYTICFNRDWNAMHRVLRNQTVDDWEAAGCPRMGFKPREDDVVATHPVYGPAMRYETVPPLQGHEGALNEMAMYAGKGVHKVNDLPPAKDLIARLWKEFKNI